MNHRYKLRGTIVTRELNGDYTVNAPIVGAVNGVNLPDRFKTGQQIVGVFVSTDSGYSIETSSLKPMKRGK